MDNETQRSSGKRRLRKVLYVYIAVISALIFCSKTIYNYSLPKVSVVMPRTGRLNKELETRGVIRFAKMIEICADTPGRIDELLIHEGDVVSPGTAIARLTAPKPDEAAVARINNRLAGLELSKSDIQSKLAALEADPGELISYENAVADAGTALTAAQAEYDEAERNFRDGYGDYADYAYAVADAERELGRKRTELQKATDELAFIESDTGKSFDDYEYRLAAETAEINLARRRDELKKAEKALNDAKGSSDSFDDYEYRKSAESAGLEYNQSEISYRNALENYNTAGNYYYNLLSSGGDSQEIARAEQAMNAAAGALRDAEQAVNAASDALRTATEDMQHARNQFQSTHTDAKENTVSAAESGVNTAKNAVADAERELSEAEESLRRAESAFNVRQTENKEDEREAAEQKLEEAQAAALDAEYTYNNAVSELGRAAEKVAKDELYEFETAGIKLTEARTALDRAVNNLEIATAKQLKNIEDERKDLNLQLAGLELDTELAEIDMLEAQPPAEAFGKLTSGYSGIIVSVDKKIGQYASAGERIAVAGAADGGFICEVTVPEKDARFIEIGDTAAVRQSGSGNTADAFVTDITLEGDMLRLKLALESEEPIGGEYVSVKFTKQSMEYETIVPTEAVSGDPISGFFVWVLASKEGALGTEYYTRKVRVLTADKDGFYTAVSTGLDNYQPVVLSYDKEPVVNGRVSRAE